MYMNSIFLKVPKCEIFDPFFFTPINPIWVGDLRTGEQKKIFRRPWQIFAILFFLRRLSVANLYYFDIIDVSTLQRPVLHLGLSTLQRRVLHLDVSTLQRHVLHIDVSTLQKHVLNLDVSTLQRSLLHLDVSTSWCPVWLLKVSKHRDL